MRQFSTCKRGVLVEAPPLFIRFRGSMARAALRLLRSSVTRQPLRRHSPSPRKDDHAAPVVFAALPQSNFQPFQLELAVVNGKQGRGVVLPFPVHCQNGMEARRGTDGEIGQILSVQRTRIEFDFAVQLWSWMMSPGWALSKACSSVLYNRLASSADWSDCTMRTLLEARRGCRSAEADCPGRKKSALFLRR